MELDEQLGVHNGKHQQWGGSQRGGDGMDIMQDDDMELGELKARYQKLEQEMIDYGMELKEEFENDPRREIRKALNDTFALIAYENVADSAWAPLLDPKGRAPLAEELNSAILGEWDRSFSPAFCTDKC